MEILRYVARYKLKRRLKFDNDILQSMESIVLSSVSFLHYIEDTKGEATLMQIRKHILKALQGDNDFIQFLELHELPEISVAKMREPPTFSLIHSQYFGCKISSIVGAHIKHPAMQNVNLRLCSYLDWITSESYPKKNIMSQIDGSNICTTLLEHLNYLRAGKFIRKSEIRLRERNIAETEQTCQALKEQIADPTYKPSTTTEEEEDEDEEEGAAYKQVQENIEREGHTTAIHAKSRKQAAKRQPRPSKNITSSERALYAIAKIQTSGAT